MIKINTRKNFNGLNQGQKKCIPWTLIPYLSTFFYYNESMSFFIRSIVFFIKKNCHDLKVNFNKKIPL